MSEKRDTVFISERARIAHEQMKSDAKEAMAPVRDLVERMRGWPISSEELLAAEQNLARGTWDLARDAMMAALEVDREEQLLRADVAARGVLLDRELRDE